MDYLNRPSLPPHISFCEPAIDYQGRLSTDMPPQNQARSDNDSENLLNSGGEILDSSTSTETTKYFEVKWFSDWEGYGCVAARDIERYTLIHIETPFIKGDQISNALNLHNNGQLKSKLDDKEYLKHICGKSDEEIERLWQLHDQYQHKYKEQPSTKRLWGIISSNSFENHEKNFQKRLYMTTSRFNHSCSPNVAYEIVGWTIRLYAIREIKAGDTLCISYSDVMYHFPSEKRKKYLLGALNFDCACTACDSSIDPATRMKSDDNRERLKKIAIELKHRVNANLYSSGKHILLHQCLDDHRVYYSSLYRSLLLLTLFSSKSSAFKSKKLSIEYHVHMSNLKERDKLQKKTSYESEKNLWRRLD